MQMDSKTCRTSRNFSDGPARAISNTEEIRWWWRLLCCLLRLLGGGLAVFSLLTSWVWEIRQYLDDLPHRRAFHALFLHAQHGDVEDVHDLVQGNRGKPGVHDLDYSFLVASRHPLNPLHDVDALPELPHRLPARHQLQQHHPEAVHIALLVHLQRVCILCGTKLRESIMELEEEENRKNGVQLLQQCCFSSQKRKRVFYIPKLIHNLKPLERPFTIIMREAWRRGTCLECIIRCE
ncbi:hypothetical protein BHE74_00011292 [Ensete ventricosum]|nr:hypothetical protein BHE74_00011292 [Ensete ventricosum]